MRLPVIAHQPQHCYRGELNSARPAGASKRTERTGVLEESRGSQAEKATKKKAGKEEETECGWRRVRERERERERTHASELIWDAEG